MHVLPLLCMTKMASCHPCLLHPFNKVCVLSPQPPNGTFAHLINGLHNSLQLVSRDAEACVCHMQHRLVLRNAHTDLDAPFECGAAGIAQKVEEHLNKIGGRLSA
jgi:hypothetical protein